MPITLAPEDGYYTISSPIAGISPTRYFCTNNSIYHDSNDTIMCQPIDATRPSYVINTAIQATAAPSYLSRAYHVDEEIPEQPVIPTGGLTTLNPYSTSVYTTLDNLNYYENTCIKADFSNSYEALEAKVKEQEKTIQFLIDTLHDKGLLD